MSKSKAQTVSFKVVTKIVQSDFWNRRYAHLKSSVSIDIFREISVSVPSVWRFHVDQWPSRQRPCNFTIGAKQYKKYKKIVLRFSFLFLNEKKLNIFAFKKYMNRKKV